ncbi:putative PurR-regulated permease PerM [Aurantimicrobium minutum]|uniref:AI-2E family transporter n=1 Tax=Aurantimicrobium minutum TaxID=708131 RepID=UPI0024766B9D|nr:AI-2E family transporter [Aurantimicrobium minutum]MDH6532712.1 putative PurR-regulated permease PerM [Aurantimicrobium minutum]
MRIQNAFRAGLIGSLGVGLGIILMTAVQSLATVLTYIFIALFLSLGLDPAVKWLETKKFPKWAAITTVIVGIVGVFVGMIVAILPVMIDQMISLWQSLPTEITHLQTQDWITYLDQQFGDVIDVNAVISEIGKFFSDPANISKIAGGALAVGVGVANALSGTLIVVILTLYFTASLSTVKKVVYDFVPKTKRENFVRMSEQITNGVGKYVVGQIALALLNGILAFVMLTIIGGKQALLFAFLAFLFALIPLIGTVMSSIIVTLGQLMLAGPETAIVIGIYFLIYMQIEAYVLSPRIMNKAISIPGSVVVIAALAGGTLMGILGALVAIPIAASIVLIIKEVIYPAQDEI